MNREELDLHTQDVELQEALAAAKQAHADKPTDKTRANLQDAKVAIREFRQKWRSVREAFAGTATDGDAVATPDTTRATTSARS